MRLMWLDGNRDHHPDESQFAGSGRWAATTQGLLRLHTGQKPSTGTAAPKTFVIVCILNFPSVSVSRPVSGRFGMIGHLAGNWDHTNIIRMVRLNLQKRPHMRTLVA